MTTITLRLSDNAPVATIKKMLSLIKGVESVRVESDKPENPSPSGDPYFADPRNIAELERRMADKTPGEIISIEQLEELLND